MKDYEIAIGLEVHVQLLTQSKVFCGCSTKFGQEPNSLTCPVCLGLPGALPVLNEKAFMYSIKTALSLGCKIQDLIKFDRKNYYYPDLPKNFQISQYDKPLAYDGSVEVEEDGKKKKIRIKRVHLEEDAGKLIHDHQKGVSYVDLNRTGMPLLEIVTEPDIRSADEASKFLQSVKAILLYLGVSDCNMEEGNLRCDANISVRLKGEKELGVKAELKNMNSFKAVRDALSYEAKRQIEMLEKGEKIVQETRLWSEERQSTLTMRTKEETEEYRYFPEPDLVPFTVDRKKIEEIRKSLPELPQAKRDRFIKSYSLSAYDCDVLTRDREVSDFFEEAVKIVKSPKEAANWLLGDVASILNEKKVPIGKTALKPAHLAGLIKLIKSEEISGKIAKEILPEMIREGTPPAEIVKKKGLGQIKDQGELSSIIEDVLKENEKSVNDYKKGKEAAMTFLIGQVMKKTKGKANPKKVNEILKNKLPKILIALILFLYGIINIGCAAERAKDEDRELYRQIELFSDGLTIVQSEYVEKPEPKKLVYGALEGMLSSLDDYSQFMDPESFKEMKIETKGEFGGLGIEIGIRDGILTIIAPIDGTPADKAGLKAGDKIVKIDGELTRDITLAGAVKKLRGKPNTKVDLTVLRENEEKILDFTIMRSIIKLESIKTAKIISDNIGYVKLIEFQANTPRDLEKNLLKLQKEGMQALILDLRNNPGGLLDVANDVAGEFLPAGTEIVTLKARPPKENKVFKSAGGKKFLNFPMVVMVNEGSASASEIVAGAIRDQKRGIILGAKTYGKGSVQTVVPLKDGSAVRLTTAAYYTPSGTNINEKGIEPDVKVELQEKEASPCEEDVFDKVEGKEKAEIEKPGAYDNQIQAAIDVLRGVLIYVNQKEKG